MSDLIYSVHDIFDSTASRGCLQQHGCSAYRIPPYQRGYKWGSENKQPVERLLSDLIQAWKSNAKEYLLQAITVKKVADGQNGSVLEVIDGQQRLTTLFILIHATSLRVENSVRPNIAENKLRYSIRHDTSTLDELVAGWLDAVETPPVNFEQLKAIHQVDQEPQQDDYYFKCAALRCLSALANHSLTSGFEDERHVADFRDFVFHRAKLMVNTVEAHVSGETIFGNLNSNRVPLTETELIKGLLLTRAARESASSRPRQYREVLETRIQLGRKWDEMNHWADLPEIRSLYFPASGHGGMIGLLELVARQMPDAYKPPPSPADGEKSLFEYFLPQPDLAPVVRLLAHTYSRLQDWYANDQNYHLLGFCLLHQKRQERLPFLVRQLGYKTKSEWRKALYQTRRQQLLGDESAAAAAGTSVDLDLGSLHYGGENPRTQAVLLALSVFRGADDGRFNFHAYQSEDWSLEHIFPQNPFGKGAVLTEAQKKEALGMLIENKEGILTRETLEEMVRLRDAEGDTDTAKVEGLLQSEPMLHKIGNLCLLRQGDNAAMGCGMFDEKRHIIRQRIARGSFVPRHTYEVFSKMIVGEENSLDVWSKEDIDKHQAEIKTRVVALVEEQS